MTLVEQGDNELVRAIRAFIYKEMKFAKGQGLSKTQFVKAVRIALDQYKKIAVEEAKKY